MKKTKKALASLAIAGMVLTMVPFNAFATGTVSTRLAGITAAQTAVEIANQTGWTGTAILASSASYGMVDALTSGPLAKVLNAPILLQEPGAVLNADTKAELTKLNVKKVYVTSGTAVINQAVLDQLVGMGITVESLGGVDRFETSVNIAKKMVALGAPVSKVAVAYGWLNQDALSIASIASANNEPILLTEKTAVPTSVKAFLDANAAVTATDVIGGTGVISDAVKDALPNATRHFGNTAYDTNYQVIQDFNSSLGYGNVYLASGVTGIDALAGAPLAAQTKSAIVLTDGTIPAAAAYVNGKLTSESVVTALGGTAVVPESVLAGIAYHAPEDLGVTSVSAINAKQIEVKFNKAVSASSVVDTDGTLKSGVLTFATISGTSATVTDTSTASLSDDGKTLTIASTTNTFNGQYVLTTVTDTIKATDGQFLPVYTSPVFRAEDTVAPTISSVVQIDASNFRVNFSEPLSSAGSWVFKFADGTTALVNSTLSNLANGYVDLQIDSGITAGKVITATALGVADYNNNLISPNPSTFTFSKGALDGVAPTVQAITPVGLNKFEIKFSEQVQGLLPADLTVDGVAATAGTKVTQDTTDKTKYTVEISPLTVGLHTVGLISSAVSDFSGETNAAYSRVLQFETDTVAPKLVKSEVKVESGSEFLYLTFDESVTEGTVNALTATQVKDFVTVNGTINLSGLTVIADTDSKQHKVALSGINFTPASGSAAAILSGAAYTVSLTGFNDVAGNALASTPITFTRAADTDVSKPNVVLTTDTVEAGRVASNGIVVVDNDTIQVTFDKELDGASATNKANYTVNGLTINSATLLPGNKVELKFAPDTNTLDGLRNVSISGVKSKAGVVMNTYTTTEFFTENVKPFVTSATLISNNQVKVVFSEAVESSKVSAADFNVFAGTAKEDETTPFGVATASGTGLQSEYIITLANALTPAEYATALTVEVVQDADATSIITDAKANNVKTGVYPIVK